MLMDLNPGVLKTDGYGFSNCISVLHHTQVAQWGHVQPQPSGTQHWLSLCRARHVSPYGSWHGRAVAIATED